MNIRKIIALILCLVLLSITTLGCNSTDDIPDDDNGYSYDDNGQNPVDSSNAHEHGHGYMDFAAAITAFPPDTLMLTAGDFTLTWAELFVFLFRTISTLVHSYGGPLDWSEPFDLDKTLEEVILEFSTDEALNFMAFRNGANLINLQLSDEDLNAFNEEVKEFYEEFSEIYSDKDAMEESLRENAGFYNFAVFEEFLMTDFLIGLLFEELYGENGDSIPDDELNEFASEYDFMMAMHILRLKSDDPDADPLGEAEDILAQLKAKVGSDDFTEYFHDLMHEMSEDTGGLMSYPNGYLFLHEDMVPEFSDTTAELKIGELSGIVETVYGYHIILRIPIDFDAVPSGLSREGRHQTLRQLAAYEDFDFRHNEWVELLNAVFTPEYNSITLSEIFVWHDEDCDH